MAKKEKPPKLSKAEKKELKKQRAEAIKQAKKNGTYRPEDFEDDDAGGPGLIILAAVFIIIVWLAIFAILIHMDVGGLGSTVMYPILKDIPIVKEILPPVEETEVEDETYKFANMDEAIARIKELEAQIASYEESGSENGVTIAELRAQVEALQPYKDNVDAFNAERQKFYNEVVFSDQAPDIKEYKAYYESIDPTNAENIYKQVVSQIQEDQAVKDYAMAYSSMEAKKAAGIFDSMTNDFALVARILKAMNAQERGAILAEMNATNAAAITQIMEPKR